MFFQMSACVFNTDTYCTVAKGCYFRAGNVDQSPKTRITLVSEVGSRHLKLHNVLKMTCTHIEHTHTHTKEQKQLLQ